MSDPHRDSQHSHMALSRHRSPAWAQRVGRQARVCARWLTQRAKPASRYDAGLYARPTPHSPPHHEHFEGHLPSPRLTALARREVAPAAWGRAHSTPRGGGGAALSLTSRAEPQGGGAGTRLGRQRRRARLHDHRRRPDPPPRLRDRLDERPGCRAAARTASYGQKAMPSRSTRPSTSRVSC